MTNLAYNELMNDKEVLAVLDRRYTARQKKIKAKKRAKAIYYMKQKLLGVVLAAVGILVPVINSGDATASLILLPLGIYLTVTKERVIMF